MILSLWMTRVRPRDHPALRVQVVPFSPSAGLLEWVEDTLPLTEYLIGPNKVYQPLCAQFEQWPCFP